MINMYRVKKGFDKVTVERVIPGFGQIKFKLGEMESGDVEKWIKRGAKIGEYFDSVTEEQVKKSEKDKVDEDAARLRYRARVERLLACGFVRVKDDFTKEGGKTISAKVVADSEDVNFDEFLSSVTPLIAEASVAPVVTEAKAAKVAKVTKAK